MQSINLLWLIAGVVIGAIGLWFASRGRSGDLRKSVNEARDRENEAKERADGFERHYSQLVGELKDALEEKGRYQSEAARVDEMKRTLVERDEQLGLAANRIQALDREKTEALTKADAAAKHSGEMVAKEREALEKVGKAKDELIAKLGEFIMNAESALTKEFKAISADVLKEASAELVKTTGGIIKIHGDTTTGHVELHKQQIENMLKPVGDSLERLDKHVKDTEGARQRADVLLNEQVSRLAGASESLTNALRKPVVRGSWGEMTLENALENAGLQAEIDFVLQHSTEGEDGLKRTDAVIKLPKGRKLIIDSKNLMQTYIPLASASDEAQRSALASHHSKSLRNHMKDLSSKRYWERYEGLDCVILFIPHDGMYHAAIHDEAELIREACEKRVFISNPMTLIPLLKAVHYVLDQEKSNKSAAEVRDLGRELYVDIQRFAEHMTKIGCKIEDAAKAYNAAIPSLDRYILSKSRKLKAFGSSKGTEVEVPEPIEVGPKLLSRELTSPKAPLNNPGIFDIAADGSSVSPGS